MWYTDLRPDEELNTNRYFLVMLDKYDDYARLLDNEGKERTIKGLLKLKEGLLNNIPSKGVDKNLLLASWNIKNFGRLKDRTAESLFYIAEIINAFDIVALQEINGDLDHFDKVMKLLGSDWKYTISDVTEGNAGNEERFGFIYDSRRVTHSGLSGELVIPDEFISANPIIKQLKRTPTFTGFESGWKKFSIVSLHLHPGDGTNDPDEPTDKEIRKEEVRLLMQLLELKLNRSSFEERNLIVLGDTNLYEEDEDIVQLMNDKGFFESDGLKGKYTNTSLNQIYDRIFLHVDQYFKIGEDEDGQERGGVFKLFDYVYKNTPDAILKYHELMLIHKDDPSTLTSDEAFRTYFNRYWKRNQISDHLPVWLEIETDSTQSFLQNKLNALE
ncbi:Endonuclease/exonuclease/phosphatase [Allomuricauda ruestringensis DSM 13258]|uniref:Endonuclease/exonuclease/phosphatase n=1 Tax=Allomuricauda ruestringensis (strain DSM 13258 / CIP 107369 / LMG 19739 / B1) TaxID=886377 RepID=G2PLU4_ALLRU|nr:endonuclease/exonuclease/phosphatase family protein [Allomuricauda ruestringensis]AEM72213.1 Endonuclease/exonuclease/phosphatase [Allomuricauda ruestringensis DSM 13258]